MMAIKPALVRAGILAVAAGALSPVVAQDAGMSMADGAVRITGGVGILGIEAHEYVYESATSDNLVSHLIWQSLAPVLAAGLDVRLPDGWTIAANADIAMGGDSYMEDYDWFGLDFVSFAPGDWTHRSQHDLTSLAWYFSGSLLVGRDIAVTDGVTVNVNGGVRYTDVKWTSTGGSYVYSRGDDDQLPGSFRGNVGSWPDDAPAINYHQRWPALVAGLDVTSVDGGWTFSLGAHGGVAIGPSATDNHNGRIPPLTIDFDINATPLVSLGAGAAYEVSDRLDIFVRGKVERIFDARATGHYYDGAATDDLSIDGNGAGFMSASVAAGLSGRF